MDHHRGIQHIQDRLDKVVRCHRMLELLDVVHRYPDTLWEHDLECLDHRLDRRLRLHQDRLYHLQLNNHDHRPDSFDDLQ